MPADHLVAARPQSEDEATTGNQVEGRCRLRQQRGRPAEDVHDAGAEPDALGARRECPENGDGVRSIRLGHPDRVESTGLGALGQLERVGE